MFTAVSGNTRTPGMHQQEGTSSLMAPNAPHLRGGGQGYADPLVQTEWGLGTTDSARYSPRSQRAGAVRGDRQGKTPSATRGRGREARGLEAVRLPALLPKDDSPPRLPGPTVWKEIPARRGLGWRQNQDTSEKWGTPGATALLPCLSPVSTQSLMWALLRVSMVCGTPSCSLSSMAVAPSS